MRDARQLLDAYPHAFDLDAQVLAATIDVLSDCAQACTACADDCLSEAQVAELVTCVRLCLDCADVCTATLRVLSRQTDYDATLTRPQLQACVAACNSCGDEAGGTPTCMSIAGCAPRPAGAASRPAPSG